jgi:hypothetical protein
MHATDISSICLEHHEITQRCLGFCRECDSHLEQTGRLTTYCPSCDTCSECGGLIGADGQGIDGFIDHRKDCSEHLSSDPSRVRARTATTTVT